MVTVRIFFGPGAPGTLAVAADVTAVPGDGADGGEAWTPLGPRFAAVPVVIAGAFETGGGSAALAALLNDGPAE